MKCLPPPWKGSPPAAAASGCVRNRLDSGCPGATSCRTLSKFFRAEGLYTFVRWNTFFTNPPLCITEGELAEAFEIIDRGLELADAGVRS